MLSLFSDNVQILNYVHISNPSKLKTIAKLHECHIKFIILKYLKPIPTKNCSNMPKKKKNYSTRPEKYKK